MPFRVAILTLAVLRVCAGQEAPHLQVDVNEVVVSVSVIGSNGVPLSDLSRDQFILLDNGEPRPIRSFRRETDVPLTVGLVMDFSTSQLGIMRKHPESVRKFLTQIMRPQDQAFLMTIGKKVRMVTDLTHSTEELSRGLAAAVRDKDTGPLFGEFCQPPRTSCDTPLWDGLYTAVQERMRKQQGRKALIVLSDGGDMRSRHSRTDLIEAAQSSDTLIYLLQFLPPLYRFNPLVTRVDKSLIQLGEETGGKTFLRSKDKDVEPLFREIERELRNLYVLGFTPPEEARNGVFRKLQVRVELPDGSTGIRVRSRPGYALPVQ